MSTIPAQRPAEHDAQPSTGACYCDRSATAAPGSRALVDCTCEWDELISALMHLAYGADAATRASAGPALAAMAHDLVYRARHDALRELAGQWAGTRTAFAAEHGLSRSQLYNIIS